MANLLPPSKINPTKLLGGSIVTKKISAGNISEGLKTKKPDELFIIKQQVFKIRDLVKESYLLKKSEAEKERKQREKERFRQREERLEKKPDDAKSKVKLPETPKLGFLDRIKNFIFNVLLGYVVVRLLPHLPKLVSFVKVAAPAFDFIVDMSVGLFDGLVTFIDKGYEARDKTLQFIKKFGGDNAENMFKMFEGAVGKVIEAAIIVGLSSGELFGGGGGGGKPPRRGFDTTGRRVGVDAQRRFADRYGREEFIKRFGKDNLKNLSKPMQRGLLQRGARSAFVGIAGKGGAKAILGTVRPLLKRLPIIGALIDFGLSVALGEDPGRAAFKAIGAGLLGSVGAAIGSVVPIAGNIVGGIVGGMAGDAIGGALYDMFFGSKKPKQQRVQGRAEGGSVTRGGKLQGAVKRRVSKKTKSTKRTVKVTPKKLNPGSSIGGKKKIEKIFPKSETKDTVSPLDYVEKSYKTTSEIPFFGPIFNIAYKTLVGDTPSKVDYTNVSTGLNSWMNTTFNSDVMRGGGLGFAGGGEVNAEMFIKGEDLTNAISKSVEESFTSKIDDVIKELQNQLNLKEIDRGKEPGQTQPGPEDEPAGSPNLVGNSNAEKVFRYLVDKEGFTQEAAAGIIGNLMQESGVNPKSRQLGGGPGRGIMQWTETERWASLTAWAKNSGKDPWALETQVQWMIKEMKDYGTYNRIKGVTSYKKSVEIFEREMERAGVPNYPRRYQFAADALASFGSGGSGAGGGTFAGGGTGAGYGSGGVKIAGDLGDFMKANRSKIGITGSIHQHPRHPGQFRRSYPSYHNQNRALDIGGYGPNHPSSGGVDEQAPVIRSLLEWNKKNGYKPVQLIHGSPAFKGVGTYESAPNALHSNHVHVAYGRGGFVRGLTRAILGDRGVEFVLDNDTTMALEQNFPGFLSELNKADYEGALQVLRNYASYEVGSPVEVVMDDSGSTPTIVTVPVPVPIGMGYESGSSDDPYESMAMSQ